MIKTLKFKRQPKKTVKKKKKEKVLLFQSPKGMRDILPIDQPWWEKVRKETEEIAWFYNFSRIDTPILESTDLFERSIGATTDIVEKEMFYIKSKSKDQLALRPEGTAGIVRAYIQNSLSRVSQPFKLYYIGPMFRHEQPQAGRYRQFNQVGFEILGGKDDPIHDSQIILATLRLIEGLKIKNTIIQINSLGCKNCRHAYKKKLHEYYRRYQNKICRDCKRRFSSNILRLLDCKNEDCEKIKEKAPIIVDYLCGSCRSHFKATLEYLDELKVPYIINPYLVRGLDYYNRTAFEIVVEGTNLALGGGGRYDSLSELLGGRKNNFSAVGSALGIERLVEAMKLQNAVGVLPHKTKVFLVQMGLPAKKRGLTLVEEFRKAGIKLGESLEKDSLSSQLKSADKEGSIFSLILGQKEVFEDNIIIRDMRNGVQEIIPLHKIVDEIKKRL